MSKRLEILKRSLENKETALDAKFENHFADVAQANGQPLNDKRNGAATMNRWDGQSDSIRTAKKGIEVTKSAIEREEGYIAGCEHIKTMLPAPILAAIESKELNQWRKHPNTFFVDGVEKGRMNWDGKKLTHRYLYEVTDKEQYSKFAKLYNRLQRELSGAN